LIVATGAGPTRAGADFVAESTRTLSAAADVDVPDVVATA
jgi:hypothetical protein